VDVGIVLPNSAPGVEGSTLLEWARRAEARGFASVGVIGRVAYPAYEELTTLAAVAAVTERVRLLTTVLIAPLRDPVMLAKQAATVDRICSGRLVLGVGVGMRPDDFDVTGTTFGDRGRRFDAMLETMHEVWGDGSLTGPKPLRGRVPLYFGTLSPATNIARRIARWGDGFLGVGSPDMVRPIVDAINEHREAPIRLCGASYFALKDPDEAERNIHAYYDDFFPFLGNAAIAAMPRDGAAVRRILDVYRSAGYDEFNFSAASTNPDEVDALAEVVFG
jgi:alkanesulfonate monooxygenase SsuD/methylene tetrahydromethanopterin reductase-like flavin-dependent oxidoreductase (luciferase family)